jgi:hypothetical protein
MWSAGTNGAGAGTDRSADEWKVGNWARAPIALSVTSAARPESGLKDPYS